MKTSTRQDSNVDITRAIARQMGLDVEIRLGPWAKIRQGLERGEIGAIQGMFYSAKTRPDPRFQRRLHDQPLRLCRGAKIPALLRPP